MSPRKTEERYHALQARAQETAKARQTYRILLDVKYGGHVGYAARKETRELERLERAERGAFDRFFAYLEAVSPRDWASGVPTHWLRDSLSWADATTRGPLSVTPPPAYGYGEADARRFAQAVQS